MVWHAILRAIISGKWQRVILQPRKIAGWTQSRSQSQIANENEWKSPLNTIGRNCQTRGLMKRSGRSWKADQLFQVKGCKKTSWDAISGCFCQCAITKMCLVLRGLYYAKMKAAHPKAIIQPSQKLRRRMVLRLIGQPFLAFDPPVVVMLQPRHFWVLLHPHQLISMLFLGYSMGLCHLYWHGHNFEDYSTNM